MSEQTLDKQKARLLALYEVSSQLGASLDPNQVINQIMDAIMHLTGAERAIMMLYDEVTGELKVRSSRTIDQRDLDAPSLQISRTVVERAIAAGKAVLTNNAQEDDRFSTQESVVGLQLRSIMCAPLRIRGYTLGAVYVDNRLFSGVFNQEDLDLLMAFANQAAIALDNARLFTQTDQALARRVEEVTLFQQIDQQLNQSLDLDRVLSLALDWAIGLTHADGGSIGLLEDDPEQGLRLRLLVHRGAGANGEAHVITGKHPVLQSVLVNGRSDIRHHVSHEMAIDGSATEMQVAVPIHQNAQIIGLITLESQNPHALDQDDVAFVERLADRAAVAIKNAQLYADLQAASKAKTDFVSLVTHELRLPLTSIKGYADLMKSGMAGELTEQQKQFLDVIQRNLKRMSSLISDLSDINRVEAGRMKFELQNFDIHDVVDDVVDTFQSALTEKGQTLTIDIADDVPELYADPKRISQVLTNLVSNAHKYSPENGRIHINIHQEDNFAHIAVSDNGYGISEENQAKLFTQFFRAEDEVIRAQTGWGLGLSIVKKMVEAQGGEITFTSKLGEGSTFVFTVPIAAETVQQA